MSLFNMFSFRIGVTLERGGDNAAHLNEEPGRQGAAHVTLTTYHTPYTPVGVGLTLKNGCPPPIILAMLATNDRNNSLRASHPPENAHSTFLRHSAILPLTLSSHCALTLCIVPFRVRDFY